MKKWSVVSLLALAQFVMVLDSTVMNVSISTVVEDLDTTITALQSAITFYTLTMAALMLVGAKLCAKWGLMKSFAIGSVVYGIGSLITAVSQNITQLFIGWSIIEGLGAVLVIPAIAALIAVFYKGKDRVVAFAIIGGVSGAAAAAGPLIGGFMTTYLSWRYVFAAETIIMIFVLFLMRRHKSSEAPADPTQRIDGWSAFLSIFGMTSLVYGVLQSKTWGWIIPMAKPEINGNEIAPFGISIVAYLLLLGIILLKLFWDRQSDLEKKKDGHPLLEVSMLSIRKLRSGLSVLFSQYMITAGIFFAVPIYLQMVLGLDALQTGIRIMPLSIALILFSLLGVRFSKGMPPRRIVRVGQVLLILGSLGLVYAINPDLTGNAFGIAMFLVGAGLGLLASQLGNVNMSSVDASKSSQVGGLQGTFQNLGSSFGTALIGSVLIASLTAGLVTSVNSSSLPDTIKSSVEAKSQSGVTIVAPSDVEQYALESGATESDAAELSKLYEDAQLQGLKEAIFFLVIVACLSILLSRNIPDKLS